ncbi:hypothetical protein LB692_001758, partial [Campylobacter coli]|nr:hypothetical protein [Campylobacter coli]
MQKNITSNLIFTNEQIAINYGLTTGLTIAEHLRMHNDEFIENTHYFLVENSFKNKTIKWTLEGVCKLFDKIKKLKERNKMTEEKENIVNFKIKIIHEENIELGIMANSLLSFQKLMDSFISKEHGITQSKIFLEKVETGSDIYSLVFEIAGEVLPIIAPIQALNEFIELIISFKNIKSKSIEEIEENPHFTKYNANNLKNIFAPVTINQNTFFINHKGEELLRINSDEAELIYENANYICEKKEIEYQKIHENALITMYKTTNKIDNKTKHKAKCDALSPYAVDVSFSDEKIAEEVL